MQRASQSVDLQWKAIYNRNLESSTSCIPSPRLKGGRSLYTDSKPDRSNTHSKERPNHDCCCNKREKRDEFTSLLFSPWRFLGLMKAPATPLIPTRTTVTRSSNPTKNTIMNSHKMELIPINISTLLRNHTSTCMHKTQFSHLTLPYIIFLIIMRQWTRMIQSLWILKTHSRNSGCIISGEG